MNLKKEIKCRRLSISSSLLLVGVLAGQGCAPNEPDHHICDPSKVISLHEVPRFAGTWAQDPKSPNSSYRITISPEGTLLHPALGCATDKYPLVFEDYNAMPGTDGPGTGYRRLEYVQITPSELKFFWKVNRTAKFRSEETKEMMRLTLQDDETMQFEFSDNKGQLTLHKLGS